jgi:hypothetical protein
MTIDIGSNLTTVLMALIAAIGSIVAAFFAYKASGRAATATIQAAATHNLVNSRMTELLALSNAAARANGVAAGMAGNTTVPTVLPGDTNPLIPLTPSG